ncbi:MAG: electron transport complex subunit RsxG [Gammaproteobacteria bacterium]|nr:electron transport complex subunit RsxG [Gammaproteobacteria bacterium]
MLIGALLLAAFAFIGTGLVSATYEATASKIAENERQRLLSTLNALVPASDYNNAIESDLIHLDAPQLSGQSPLPIYRARFDGKPVAVVIASTAPDGYAGPIKLLIGIRYDGELSGVRVISHKETPGLGDAIEIERSDWLLGFNGKSLENTPSSGWKVKKDGGIFDQFTGATITPRIIVKAIYGTLNYYKQHREAIFATTPVMNEANHG